MQNDEASHRSLKFRKLIGAPNMHKRHCFRPLPNYYATKAKHQLRTFKNKLYGWRNYCGHVVEVPEVHNSTVCLFINVFFYICHNKILVFMFKHKVSISATLGNGMFLKKMYIHVFISNEKLHYGSSKSVIWFMNGCIITRTVEIQEIEKYRMFVQ